MLFGSFSLCSWFRIENLKILFPISWAFAFSTIYLTSSSSHPQISTPIVETMARHLQKQLKKTASFSIKERKHLQKEKRRHVVKWTFSCWHVIQAVMRTCIVILFVFSIVMRTCLPKLLWYFTKVRSTHNTNCHKLQSGGKKSYPRHYGEVGRRKHKENKSPRKLKMLINHIPFRVPAWILRFLEWPTSSWEDNIASNTKYKVYAIFILCKQFLQNNHSLDRYSTKQSNGKK